MKHTFKSDPLIREMGGEQCICCKHYHIGIYPRTCDAFPQRIPVEILLGNHDHDEPFEGDGGIRFEALSKVELDERIKLLDESIASKEEQESSIALAIAK